LSPIYSKVERVGLAHIQRDWGVTVTGERLQERLSKVGQVIRALDHALHHADAMVSPFIDDLRRQEAHPAFDHACKTYEETVEAVTQTRQQLFDLPMIVTLLAQAPPEERGAALRRIEQHVSGLHGIEEALDAAAINVVKTWKETLTDVR
jgi:hypothetical protein